MRSDKKSLFDFVVLKQKILAQEGSQQQINVDAGIASCTLNLKLLFCRETFVCEYVIRKNTEIPLTKSK
uniref:Uncharacterized protein n=1 Tax=Strongyloides venezuelensis TaxID=75913 RepID=A0A0K0F8H0_STRVS